MRRRAERVGDWGLTRLVEQFHLPGTLEQRVAELLAGAISATEVLQRPLLSIPSLPRKPAGLRRRPGRA